MPKETIVVGCDQAGYDAKCTIKSYLDELGFDVLDVGNDSATEVVNYPVYAKRLAEAIRDGKAKRGFLFCGSGVGVCMAANRYPWIRACQVYNATIALYTRDHNDANVGCFGGQHMGLLQIRDCVRVFLETPFSGVSRHLPRLDMIADPFGDF